MKLLAFFILIVSVFYFESIGLSQNLTKGNSAIQQMAETPAGQLTGVPSKMACTSSSCAAPVVIGPLIDGVEQCVDECNTGSPNGPNFNGNNCYDFPDATAWFQITTGIASATLEITVTSADLSNPFFAVFGTTNCANYTIYNGGNCYVGAAGSVIGIVDIPANTTLLIAVSDDTGNEGDFTICVETQPDLSACNLNDAISVTNTSLGSPVGGPYLPGEVVSFCYSINQYTQANCNWLHGIVPEFGDCWDAASFAPNGEPVSVTTALLQAGDYCPGGWDWFADAVVGYGGNPGNPVGAGWFYSAATWSGGPQNPNPNTSWGDGNGMCANNPGGGGGMGTCEGAGSGLSWSVCFDLTVRTDCANGAACDVAFKTYADGETGGWTNLGCASDITTFQNATLICCLLQVEAGANTSFCAPGAINLNGSFINNDGPANVTWTASPVAAEAGLSNPNILNPTFTPPPGLSGPVTFTLSVTDDACTIVDVVTITVNTTPIIDPIIDEIVCDSYVLPGIAGSNLTGSQAYYTGPNGTGVQYLPGSTINFGDFGAYPVTLYAYDETGTTPNCFDEESFALTIIETPTVALPAFTGVCINEGIQSLGGGTVTGGSYSGAGVTDDGNGISFTFDPIVAGVGVHTITYTVTTLPNPPACSDFATNTIEVYALPALTFTAINDLCINAGIQSGNVSAPIGGVYSGPGVTDNGNGSTYSFDPLTAGVGVHTITYSFTDANFCTNSITDDVEVFPTPVLNFPALVGVCLNAGVQSGIGAATVTGGVYSGAGVTDDADGLTFSFDPIAAGVGVHVITYTFTDANFCTTSITQNIEVFPTPALNFPALADVCLNAGVQAGIGAATVTGGSYSGAGVTDDGNGISFTFDPIVAGVGVHTITYTVTTLPNPPACSDFATNTIEVYALPTLTLTAINDLCINAGIQSGSGSTPIGGVYSGPGVTDNGNGSTYSFDPLTAGVGVHTITYTFTDANFCTNSITDDVEVFPTPVLNFPALVGVCLNAGVQSGIGAATVTGGVYSGAGVTDDANGLTFSFDPIAAGVGVHVITYTFTDANFCTTSITQNIEVFPTPALNFPALADVCLNAGVQAGIGAATVTGGSYSGAGVTDDGNGISFAFDPIVAGVGVHTITYTVTDANFCTASITQTIEVADAPTISGTFDVCVGLTTALTGSGTPNATAPWTSSNTAVATVDINGVVTGVSGGTVTITYTDDNGCTAQETVTVNVLPVITLTPDDPDACDATDGFITVNGAGTGTVTWSGVASDSDFPVTLPYDITGLGGGGYSVTFTDGTTGCISSSENTNLNNPGAPIINPIGSYSACEIDYVIPNPLVGITGTALTSGQAYYSAPGGNPADLLPEGTVITSLMSPMTVYAYDNNGSCDSEVSFIVNVNTNPTALISPDPASACEGTAIPLNGNPAGGSGVYSTNTWTGDIAILNASNVVNPIVLAATTTGVYNLTYTVTDNNGCVGTDNIQVTINEVPVLSGTQEVCVGLTTTINSTGTPDAVTPWTSSNTAVATVDDFGVVTGVAGGSATITFLDANGCSNTISVTVNANPIISLTPDDPNTCNASDGFITVIGTGSGVVDLAGDAIGTFGPTALPYNITGLPAGNYNVIFTDANGCISNTPATTLNNPNAPVIDPIPDTTSCAINFVVPDAATYVTGTFLTGNQEFYDQPGGNIGDLVAAGSVITAAMSPLTLYVYDINGACDAEIPFVVTVNQNPTTVISPVPAEACFGTVISLNGNPSGGSGTYTTSNWTGDIAIIDDANIVNPTTIASTAANVYNLTYTVTDDNGCIGSDDIQITIHENPIISLTPDDPNTCNASDGFITVSGTGSGVVDLAGDAIGTFGPTALPYNITGLPAGNYNVIFTDANGCISNTPATTLNNPNAPVIDPIPDTTSCAINFVVPDAATYVTGTFLTGNQEFYDQPGGNIGDLVAAGSVITAAMSPLTLYVYDINGACDAEVSFVVTINQNPTTIISPVPAELCAGLTLQLNGNPAGGSGAYATHEWTNTGATSLDFSNIVDPIFSNALAGAYDLTYTVTDDNGCIGSSNIQVTVNPNPTATISPFPAEVCAGIDLQLNGNPAGGSAFYTTHAWTNTGSTSLDFTNIENPLFNNLTAGNYDLTYTVTDDNGCVGSDNIVVLVNENPTATITPNPASTCAGIDLQLDGGPLGGSGVYSTHLWSNTGSTSLDDVNIVNPLFNNATPGNYDLTYTATDDNGCVGTSNIVVTVTGNPSSLISPDPANVCSGQNLQLNGNPFEGTAPYATHEWTNIGAASLNLTNVPNPIFNSTTAGNYNLTYTVTDANGCFGSDNITVTVVATPTIDPLGPIEACDSYALPAITGVDLTGNQAYFNDTQANAGTVVTGPITSTTTLYMYDGAAGCSDEVQVDITINLLPEVTTITGDGSYCENEVPEDVLVETVGSPDWTVYFTVDGVSQSATGSVSPINLGNSEGTYVLDSILDLNCSNTAAGSVVIFIKPTPGVPSAGNDSEYCSNVDFADMFANGAGGTMTWYTDLLLTEIFGTGNTIQPANQVGATSYYVTEIIDGCEGPSNEVIITIEICDIILPTAFTPDNDGNNDTWEIPLLDEAYPNNIVYVYNRWGSLIFEHNSQDNGPYNANQWDGTFNGNLLPVGSYFFVIDFNNAAQESATGAVSIILN